MNKAQKTATQATGIGIPSLALILAGLKLTGSLNWSWWWVLSPIWAPPLVAVIVIGVIVILAAGLLFGVVVYEYFKQRFSKEG